jgi:arylsulfatase A-like enzyme
MPRGRQIAFAGAASSLLGVAAGTVESVVRALQHSYYFNTTPSYVSYLMIPALSYAVAGLVLGIVLALVAVALRRRHVASAALASGAAFLLVGYWGSVYRSRFFDSAGHALGHLAMLVGAAALFVVVWRVARAVVGQSRSCRRSLYCRIVWATLAGLAVVGIAGWGIFFGALGSGLHAPRGDAPPAGAPNVLLVTIDTLRADRLGCYGYPTARGPRDDGLGTSPVIDALAAEGVRFDAAIVPMVTTDPSHASIMTSVYPATHGVVRNAVQLASDATTAAEIFQAAGYRTGAAVSVKHLDGFMSGLSQGFVDYYDRGDHDRFGYHTGWRRAAKIFRGRLGGSQREANATCDRAVEWLGKKDDRPFFFWAHLYDPHHPYVLHEEPGVSFRKIRDEEMAVLPEARLRELADLASRAYDSEIRHVDDAVGRLIGAVRDAGHLDETIIVVTSDHGEHISEERLRPTLWFGHYDVYEEVCRVPLIFHAPGSLGARVVPDQVSVMDIAPTLLEVSRIGVAEGEPDGPAGFGDVFGRSLAPLLGGDSWEEAPLVVDANPHGTAEGRALRTGGWKLIGRPGGESELYDLIEDPGELLNTAHIDTTGARLLGRELARIVSGWDDVVAPEPDEETREMLRSLGYIN